MARAEARQLKPTRVFVHWWQHGERDVKLIVGRARAARFIRKLRSQRVRIIWCIYPERF
jgi:hypothetical protein